MKVKRTRMTGSASFVSVLHIKAEDIDILLDLNSNDLGHLALQVLSELHKRLPLNTSTKKAIDGTLTALSLDTYLSLHEQIY